jgi:hypothetical protein
MTHAIVVTPEAALVLLRQAQRRNREINSIGLLERFASAASQKK